MTRHPTDRPVARHLLLTCALAVCACALWQMAAALLAALAAPTTWDDAYAFCRYADHLLAGHGLAWNPGGPQTYGCTSLLYTLWIAVLKGTLPLSNGTLLAIASWIPALTAIPVMAWTCHRLADQRSTRYWLTPAAFVCLATALQPGFRLHATTGMDTTLALLANAALAHWTLTAREPWTTRRVLTVIAVAYLAFLARPDNLLIAILLPVLAILLLSPPGRSRRKPLTFFCTGLAILLAADCGVKWWIFGNPLPLPFYAKNSEFYTAYVAFTRWNPIRYLGQYCADLAVPLLVLLVAFRPHAWRLPVVCVLPATITIAILCFMTQIMGDQARFFYPALPLIVIAAYAALDGLLAHLTIIRPRQNLRLVARRLVPPAAALLLFPPLIGRTTAAWNDYTRQRQHARPITGFYDPPRTARSIGWWHAIQTVAHLVEQSPPNAAWAISEHGLIGAANPDVVILDMVGLHDRRTLQGNPAIDSVIQAAPDAIWFPHDHYTGLVNDLLTHPDFRTHYDFWPAAFNYGLALRKDSPHRPAIRSALNRIWQHTYGQPAPPPAKPIAP